jgi:uncharacterized membrane protein YfhO
LFSLRQTVKEQEFTLSAQKNEKECLQDCVSSLENTYDSVSKIVNTMEKINSEEKSEEMTVNEKSEEMTVNEKSEEMIKTFVIKKEKNLVKNLESEIEKICHLSAPAPHRFEKYALNVETYVQNLKEIDEKRIQRLVLKIEKQAKTNVFERIRR